MHKLQGLGWRCQRAAAGGLRFRRQRSRRCGEGRAHRARLERKVGQPVIERSSSKKVRGTRDRSERKAMIERHHPGLSVRRQGDLLGVKRRERMKNRPREPAAPTSFASGPFSRRNPVAIFPPSAETNRNQTKPGHWRNRQWGHVDSCRRELTCGDRRHLRGSGGSFQEPELMSHHVKMTHPHCATLTHFGLKAAESRE